MAEQRRYRPWNYVLGGAIVGLLLAVYAVETPSALRRWPDPDAAYSSGRAEGYPSFGYRTVPPGLVRKRARIGDSWLSLSGDTAKYRCHAFRRITGCGTAAMGGVLNINDRVIVDYIEDLETGERYIQRVRGRGLVVECHPLTFSSWNAIGLGRPVCGLARLTEARQS
jgi:hypothetical protein